ncbi:MAG: mechanosensitive ion channel family protein [Alphaproteobacteria bacterium]
MPWVRAVSVLLAVSLFSLLTLSSPATAQNGDTGLSTDRQAVERLIQRIEDPERREALVGDLRALLAADKTAAEEEDHGANPILAFLADRINVVHAQLAGAVGVFVQIPDIAGAVLQDLQQPNALKRWGEVVGKIGLTLLAGFLAEWLVRRALAKPRRSLEDRKFERRWLRIVFLIARTLLDMLPIVAFAVAAYGVLPVMEPRQVTKLAALALVNANVVARLAMLIACAILVPDAPSLRLVPMGEKTVAYAYVWTRRFVNIGIYGYFFLGAARLLGLPLPAFELLTKLLGLILLAMAVMVVLQNRREVAAVIRGHAPDAADPAADESVEPAEAPGPDSIPGRPATQTVSLLRRRLAGIWHLIPILLLVALYATWAMEVPNGFAFLSRAILLTVVIVLAASLLMRLVDLAFDRLFAISAEFRAAYPGLEARANRYVPVLLRAFKLVIAVLAGLAILQVWGVGALAWLTSDTGSVLVRNLVTLAVVIGGAFLTWEVSSALIERSLAHEAAIGDGASARKLTLLPLLRNVVRIVLAMVTLMIVLSEIGINIGPLLAGAGVVGLAIGFGAQALVRDVITGAFILIEESISIGDVVEAGGHSGVVEAMTVRTVTLRDLNGTVHIVPFGEVTSIKNFNRGFAFALIEAGVAYREDYDSVVAVLQQVACGMREDPAFARDIIADLEVLGLDNLADSAVIIRVRLRTRPMRQWAVRREFLRRMKKAFDEAGIEIPFPHQTIYFGVDREGKAPPAHIVQETMERETAPTPPEPDAAPPALPKPA